MKTKDKFLKISIIFFITISILNFACKKDKPEPLVATGIELVSGGSQTAQVSTALPNSIVILVKDQNGNAFKGAAVKFAVAQGSVSSATGTTDAEGKATVTWTLGASEGTQTLTITAFKTDGTTALTGSPISITATASPEPPIATSIEIASGNNQAIRVSTALANPIAVLVKDQYGNAFIGSEVSFTVTEGAVSLAKVTTDANGNASVTWTLGATKGTQTLNATVAGLTGSPLDITATALDATSIEIGSGNNQTVQILTTLANPVVVTVKDQNGGVFIGVDVSFTITEGTISSAVATTDANGNASMTWTLGATAGTQTLNATVTGLTGSPIEFTATGILPVTDIQGNTYNVVAIGNQIWMAENLNTRRYPNNDIIPLEPVEADWAALADDNTSDACCYYTNSWINSTIYGTLYTYAAAIGDNWTRDNADNQGICPDGWHLPSDAEWKELEMELGMSQTEADSEGTSRGTNEGSKLSGNSSLWDNGQLKSNEEFGTSKFNVLPGGYRSSGGLYYNKGANCGFWSSTEGTTTNSYIRRTMNDATGVLRNDYSKSRGFSVRCIKD